MAITFHSNIKNLLLGRGVVNGLSGAISIYSGTQPSATTILSNWTAYNSDSATFLAHYSGAVWAVVSQNTQSMVSLTTLPTASDTVHSGTGTWCILWSTNPLLGAMSAAIIPTTSFIIAPVSITPGIGTVRFDANTTFVAGTSKIIVDGIFSSSAT